MPKLEINLKMIEADLEELAGTIPVKVKLSRNGSRLHIIENDKRTTILINPKRIRTQQQLDDVLIICRNSLMVEG